MPRLPTLLIRKAYSYSPFLPLILRATRDIDLAKNELRWIQEHLSRIWRLRKCKPKSYPSNPPTLYQLCHARSTGKPLQYILGSQPFGDLEILCRKGILIPRPETETYTTRLSNLLLRHGALAGSTEPLKILDLCSGTGCIGLGVLANCYRQFPAMQVRAVDINPLARSLAWKTVELNQRLGRLPSFSKSQFEYILADILDYQEVAKVAGSGQFYSIIISNPPYISAPAFSRDTSRSARIFEPRNALVPPTHAELVGEKSGDLFYHHILQLSWTVRPQIVCMEVADLEQALRLMRIVKDMEVSNGYLWEVKQIWSDDIDVQGNKCSAKWNAEADIAIVGSGNGRVVVLAQGWGRQVINRGTSIVI